MKMQSETRALSALDLMTSMPTPANGDYHSGSAISAVFILLGYTEILETAIAKRYQPMAKALHTCTGKLYDALRLRSLDAAAPTLAEPEEIEKLLKRLDNVVRCFAALADQFKPEDWRTVIAWMNVESRYSNVKRQVIHICAER